ncbi:uncharacterized protein K02A2.6-like [Aedes albopictus]|uniref:RNA-directed DNA polymerase n=1 Tax=Aedes albopictus TaxID=7160 RepID=A0ABM1ZGL1_AEDAL
MHVASSDQDDGYIKAKVAGLICTFLIDSGALVNTFTEVMFQQLMSSPEFCAEVFNIQNSSDRPLKAYATDRGIQVLATFEAYLYIAENRPMLLEKFYVVRENQALLSRPTATRYSVLMLGLKVPVSTKDNHCRSIISKADIASVELNQIFPKFNLPPVKIYYDETKPPCRNVFSNIPLAVKPLVEQRLMGLVSANIIEPVVDGMDTAFCSSMLVVPKGKDGIRLVIDLRGPNRYIHRTPFAMPTLEKILAELDGAQWFSTIDLANAYFHMELDKDSRHLTNFFTEFGMFRCVRLPFGLCNAPDVFQEAMQRKILAGCKGCKNYLDDVLVFGSTKEEHDQNLAAVRACLENHNVKLNEDKCTFGSQCVTFLGFKLTPDGWQIDEEKVEAIKNFRRPTTCAEVKSFLGLITFVDKFIPHRATKSEYLRSLAASDVFYWTEHEEKEFIYFRDEALGTIKRLGFFSASDRTELFVDASPVGLGAVLVQFNSEEVPRIVACASKVLSQTETRYPQTQKEALAVVWAVEKFSFYLLGRSFVIRTDAEANQYIFNSSHRLGKRAVSRAENWALRLQPYDFSIERVPGCQNVADALSRLIPASQKDEPFDDSEDNHYLYALDTGCMPMTWNEIEVASEDDSELEKVREAITSQSWPTELRAFEAQKNNLRNLGGLIFKDDKTVLPVVLRRKALALAHEGHVGEVATKRIMRQYFWWPRMSLEVGRFVKSCETCIQLSKRNPPLPLTSRVLPEGPWEILQVDFLSVPNFGTGELLVVIDTYSRYLCVVEMKGLDADSTNQALCEVFQMWGCPLVIQSDNGPPFQSTAFNQFWREKGIEVRKAIPLSPQSNGSVERQNQSIIKALAASKLDHRNWRLALREYVHRHNTIVPHSRLGVTPFEMMVGWKYRGTFPSLWFNDKKSHLDHEELVEKDAEAKLVSKKCADFSRGAKESDIGVGDIVLLAQQKKSKTDPTFMSERFTVIAREGAKVVVMSKSGLQYGRNIQEVKKAPETDSSEEVHSGTLPEDAQVEAGTQSAANEGYADLPGEEVEVAFSSPTQEPGPSCSKNLRHRTTIKRPKRFDDQYVYRVFF